MSDLLERRNQTRVQWKKFINGEPVDTSIISETILERWKIAKQEGVNPYQVKIDVILNDSELEEVLKKNEELIEICTPFLENLNNFVHESGFFCTLCDRNGYILKMLGDTDTLEKVKAGNFIVGACSSEIVAGPNGIGTAIELNKPIQIFASEHYCLSGHNYTCSGAPIHGPTGEIIGAINATGPYRNANPHTLGMVVAAAHAIDTLLLMKKTYSEYIRSENFQKILISSIPEALISIDTKNIITLVNRNAERLFNLSQDSVVGKDISKVFGKKNKIFINLVTNNKSTTDTEVRISIDNHESDYMVTSNTIISPEGYASGKVIILNEIKRTKTLVTKMIGAKANLNFNNIIGRNTNFRDTLRLAKIASENTSNVLLIGESGTGKDVFAQAIHNSSVRKDGPYVVINCAAIPRELISSELFGYEEGSFTGSKRGGNHGKFELADGGTIFLDEIGDMPLELQTSLLRVIEEKTITRIGGKKVRPIDVRIIAATNKNLKEEISKGNFREDLFYRLNVFTIKLLPLRERKDDIPLLIDFFAKRQSERMNKPIYKLHPDFLEFLINYPFPGNIRELQNIIERVTYIAPGNELTLDLLPSDIKTDYPTPIIDQSKVSSLDEMERLMMLNLIKSNLSKSEMAKKLKISRGTLYRKLKKYNLITMEENNLNGGRRSEKREKWADHIKAWKESGLSQMRYCQENALSYGLFSYWKRMIGEP